MSILVVDKQIIRKVIMSFFSKEKGANFSFFFIFVLPFLVKGNSNEKK